jgi:hypothetical protein
VFDLLGHDENDMTAALGWALRSSRPFLDALVRAGCDCRAGSGEAFVRLQTFGADRGFTDVELDVPGVARVIIEAKCGFDLPALAQLRRYRPRLNGTPEGVVRALLVVSGASPTIAAQTLPQALEGVPVRFLSWKKVHQLAVSVQGEGSHAERRLVREFVSYMGSLVGMKRNDSSWCYVVSIGAGSWDGWPISQREVVVKLRRYFHPIGGGWPTSPPNYLAFRFDGKLQSAHHVEDVEITTDLRQHFEGVPREWTDPFFVYRLGPPIVPPRDVPTGPGIRQAARVWCYLDTLLTSKTITDALKATKKRQQQTEAEPQ